MLINAENICKSYGGCFPRMHKSMQAVSEVSFSIDTGEIVGLVGASGCGKSTISKLLVGLEKATSGNIFFHGQSISSMRYLERKSFRRRCQLIFQDSLAALNPHMRVEEILHEPLICHQQNNKKERSSRIQEMLGRVHLDTSVFSKYPNELSGGQRQRVCICRALIMKPELIICDEIVSNIDLTAQIAVIDLLQELNRDLGMAILFISHDLTAVRCLCQKILVMQEGRIVEKLINRRSGGLELTDPFSRKLFASHVRLEEFLQLTGFGVDAVCQ